MALLGVWLPPYPAGMDMPVHLMSADVLARPDAYTGRFEPHLAPTSQGFVWLTAAARALGLPLVAAAKLSLTAMLAAYVGAFTAVGRAAGQSRPLGALFGVATFASFYLAMGFANFGIAVPAALAAIAAALRARDTAGWRRWIVTGAWLLLTAALHVIVAACAIVQVGATALLSRREGRGDAVLRSVVTALPATVWGLAVAWTARNAEGWGEIAASMGAHRLPLAEQAARWLAGPWGGFTALGGAVAAMVLLASLGRSDRRGAYVGATVAFWSAAYLALPWHAQGWAYAQPRVLVFAWAVPAALSAWGARPLRRLGIVTAVLALYLVAWGDGAMQAARQVELVVDGFDPLEGQPATALTASPGYVPADAQVHPLLHASAYAVPRGAWLTDRYVFNPLIHSARPLPLPEGLGPSIPQFAYHALATCESDASCARARSELADVAAQRARTWPAIVAVGGDRVLFDALHGRGLRPVDPARTVLVGAGATLRLAPSALALTWALPDGFTGPLEVRVGYPDTIGWIDGVSRAAGPNPPSSYTFRNLPGGAIAVEVRSQGQVLASDIVVLSPGPNQRALTAPSP